MDRLDKVIADVAYVLDTLMAYRSVAKTGNCNTCKIKNVCGIRPKWGQTVRYNCAFYAGGEKGAEQNRSDKEN